MNEGLLLTHAWRDTAHVAERRAPNRAPRARRMDELAAWVESILRRCRTRRSA